MADLLRLLFLVPLGYIAAVVAATATILAGWYGHQPGPIFSDIEATGVFMGVAVTVLVGVGSLAAVPAVILIALAELFRWRSVFFYLAVGGALGLLASQLDGMLWETGDPRLLLPAAGFVGAFAYWLIAGRLAGVGRAPVPPSDAAAG